MARFWMEQDRWFFGGFLFAAPAIAWLRPAAGGAATKNIM
jgi:hypothetical protein